MKKAHGALETAKEEETGRCLLFRHPDPETLPTGGGSRGGQPGPAGGLKGRGHSEKRMRV